MPILLLLLAAGLSPAAESAISRVAARYVDGVAHIASFTHLYTPAGFTTPKSESGRIWIQRRERLRFEYTTPEKKTFTYDSGEGRLYAPDDRQLTIQRLSAEDLERLPILFLTDPARLARNYEISAEEISAEPGAGNATRLLLKPRTPRPELAWLRLTVDKDGAVPGLTYEDSSGNRTEFQFERWHKEKARPDSDYRVNGPPGTRVLEN